MKELSPRRNTQRTGKPRTVVAPDERPSSPTVDTSSLRAAARAESCLFAKTDIRYWKQRLIHCAYGELARPRPFRELSARIEHEGIGFFFPLDTGVEEEAAIRALQIYRTVSEEGWDVTFRRHPREFTLALGWAENPMIFTYTTLYTAAEPLLDSKPPRPRQIKRGRQATVAIVEADNGYGKALATWLRSSPEYACRAVFSTGNEALRVLKRRPVNLVLFNRQLPDVAPGEFSNTLQFSTPYAPAIGYRIYDTSDEMFFSQPGVSEGFYFRRRPPNRVLEPVHGAWPGDPPTPTEWLARIHGYVQKIFLFPPTREDVNGSATLTSREHDILGCLRKGSPDKEIARDLKISAWTVHTHLKKIYEKLGARSRTEAVIKYLQK